MEVLGKVLAWIKSIIIDWRIGAVGLVGFTAGLIVTKDMDLIIGVAISVSMIIVDIIDKNYKSWHELHLNKKLQKTLANPKHQQQFFDNCADEEMKILMRLYREYPNSCLLPSENMAVGKLKMQMAICRVGNSGVPDGNFRIMFHYTLQPWAKEWLDKNESRLKKDV